MAEIVLTVDASQAKQALNAVNQAITQAKINGATITLDGTKVTNEVKKIDEAVKKVGKDIQKTTTEQAKNGTEGVKAVTNQFGKGVGQIRGFLRGAVSWWTLIIIAMEMATKAVKYFFNNLTQSVSKMTTRGQVAIKIAEQNKKKVQQETKAAQDLIGKLQELNKVQKLSLQQQRLADSIVVKLNKQYKELGITLDQTTGKYINLYEAQLKIEQRNRTVQANTLRNQISAQKDVINAALKTAFGSEINIDQNVAGSQFFTLAQKLGKTLGAQNADILARKWNTHDIEKQLEVIDELIAGLSSSSKFMQNASTVRDAMKALVDYKNQLRDLNSIDTQIIDANNRLTEAFRAQRDALRATKEQTDKLNKAYKDQQRANSLDGLSPEDRANALKNEVNQLEKRNQILAQTKKIRQSQYDKAMADSFSDPINFEWLEDRLRESQKSIQEIEGEYDNLVTKRSKYVSWFAQRDGKMLTPDEVELSRQYAEKMQKLTDDINKKQKELTAQQDKLNNLKSDYKDAEIQIQASTQRLLQIEQALADIDKEKVENINEIQQLTQQIANIEAQIEQAKQKQAEEQQQRIDNYKDYVNGLFRKQSDTLNAIIGKKKQSLLLQAKINAQKILGRDLTEEELETLKKYAEVDQLISKYKQGQKVDIGRQTVITNDIARKGGYASSVVVDRSVDVNQQILAVQKTQEKLMSDIKDLMKQYSVIQ